MASRNSISTGRFGIAGLRTRYFPKSRIGQGLVSVSPWLDMLLLLFFFVLLESNFVLHPGVVVELPQGRFDDGIRSELIAVVLCVGASGDMQEVVFFDDERFVLDSGRQQEKLKEALASGVGGKDGVALLLEIDQRVQHGTVVKLINIAREVGIEFVNVGERLERK